MLTKSYQTAITSPNPSSIIQRQDPSWLMHVSTYVHGHRTANCFVKGPQRITRRLTQAIFSTFLVLSGIYSLISSVRQPTKPISDLANLLPKVLYCKFRERRVTHLDFCLFSLSKPNYWCKNYGSNNLSGMNHFHLNSEPDGTVLQKTFTMRARSSSPDVTSQTLRRKPPQSIYMYLSIAAPRYTQPSLMFQMILIMSFVVMAKSRVAPLKELTLPQLGLLAAFVSARLANFVSCALKPRYPNLKVKLWSDSEIGLH